MELSPKWNRTPGERQRPYGVIPIIFGRSDFTKHQKLNNSTPHFNKNNKNNNNNNNNNSNSNYNNNGSGSRNSYTVEHGRTESNSSVRSSNSGSRRNSSNGLVNGIPVAPLAPFAPSTLVSSSSSSSIPLAPVVQQQRMRMYRVVVPNGVVAGSEFTVNAGGRNYSILCPRNGGPGSMVEVQLPAYVVE